MNEEIEDPYHLTPEEARAWRQKIQGDQSHAYWDSKATTSQRKLALAFVQRLYEIENGTTDTIAGYINEHEKEEQKIQRQKYGNALDGHLATGYDPWQERRDAERAAEAEELLNSDDH